jgi:hypothetical protein
MAEHVIAVSTYGSHRVKNAHTGQMVSAQKIGYSSAASAVLLALYSDRARDVSSKQASYHYIQIDAEVTVRHGYILLKVSDGELASAEAITRQAHRPAVYRWRDDAWVEFPSLKSPDYAPVIGRSGPGFNPTGMRIVAAATGEAEAAVSGILVEKTQRSASDTPWFWLRGDTYPHRETLKRWGCRWSKKRKSWYYIGANLPDTVQQLIEQVNAPSDDSVSDDDHDPCSVEEAAAVLGLQVKDTPTEVPATSDGPPRLFDLNEIVYARHDLETPDGQHVPTGTQGTITRLYNRNPTHGWSYDVDFAGIGVGWFFERELTSLEPTPGIRVTRGSVVPPGAVPPPTDAEVKRALVEGGHQPEAIATEAETPPVSDTEDDEEPKIRIIKPVLSDDDTDPITTAVRQTRPETMPVLQSTSTTNGRRNLVRIPQSACGELTGSITGNVWAYGWAVHEGVCVYVNMGGPRMAVEAIRAKMSKGDIVNCVPWDAPSIELTAGEGNSSMYTAFMQNIPEAKFTSLILCHELLTDPNYGGKSTTFIFHVSDDSRRGHSTSAMAQLRHHVTKLVKVPVFPDWTGYLWQAGQSAMLVRPTRTGGDVKLWTIDMDADSWTRLITGGLAKRIIQFP